MEAPSGRALGIAGEAAARRFLEEAGLTIVAAGFRVRCGEIDLIACDGPVMVFVEVKTRSSEVFGRPAESVTPRKRGRIVRAASVYLLKARWTERPCRFDVVEVFPVGAGWRVKHLVDAFRPGD